tara:strand:- start:167 stop:304 length:138 start_codon:yes stop_codon:yes gene_type:complete
MVAQEEVVDHITQVLIALVLLHGVQLVQVIHLQLVHRKEIMAVMV